MKKIREVIRMRYCLNAGIRQIAAACNIGRTTVSEYVERAEAAKLSWPSAGELSDEELQELLFPPERAKRVPTRPLPDWSRVRQELSRKGTTLLLLWNEYIKKHPDGYSYSRYARYYREWVSASDLRMRQPHKAGEKMQVDWSGLGIQIVDAKTGEVTQASVFVCAMGSSQMIFAKAYQSQELKWWLSAHADAFEYYCALPEIVVPDNPKTGVISACRYEPTLNPAYADLAAHYAVAVVPARVRKPRDKAKVENAVQQVERWILAPLREQTFFSVCEANRAIAELLATLNEKVMKGPKLSRSQLFELEDKPAMRPLPESRYTYAEWKRCKVPPDYHVEVEGHFYSVPFTLCGKHVDVRMTIGTVEVFFESERRAAHKRSLARRGFTTDPSHMPEGHKAQAKWTPERMIRWAETIGLKTGAFVTALLCGKLHPEHGYRMCLGVISLEKRFGKDRLELACGRALSLGALSYQSVKSILEKNLEGTPVQQPLPPLADHENIRGSSYFTQEEIS
jgi:transposase